MILNDNATTEVKHYFLDFKKHLKLSIPISDYTSATCVYPVSLFALWKQR